MVSKYYTYWKQNNTVSTQVKDNTVLNFKAVKVVGSPSSSAGLIISLLFVALFPLCP